MKRAFSNEKFRVNYGAVEIDQYKLPPLMVITTCPISWVMANATSNKHSKYLAAQIILGQPFNRNYNR